jgi:O-antigen ligase
MYQPAYAMPWQNYATPLRRTGAWGDYFRGVTFIAWLFLLILGFWWLRNWNDIYNLRLSGIDRQLQYIGYGIAVAGTLTFGLPTIIEEIIRFGASFKGRCLGGFCLLMLALSPISLTPLRSASYALATLGALLVCSCMWRMDYDRLRRIMFLAAAVIFAFLIVLIIHHGLSRTSVGGIQRNRFSQAALTAAICMFVARGKLKWAGLLLGIAMALVVNSRGTLLAFGAFTGVYLALKHGMGRGMLAMAAVPLAAILFLAIPKIGDRTEDVLVNQVAKVGDKARGTGSGFSGRLETWKRGLNAFMRSPAVGHGFRTRAGAGEGDDYLSHSGYVNLLADTGLVGAALIFGAFIYDFLKRFSAAGAMRRQYGHHMPPGVVDTFELHCVVCAFFVAESALWLFEPLYLNLGATLSILFILLVTAPYTVGRQAPAASYAYGHGAYYPPVLA